MTRHDYEIYLLLKHFNEEKAHDFLVKCRKRDRMDESGRQNTKVVYSNEHSDYWAEKTVYPYEFTAEEIEEYVEENWIHIYSAYDCTGRTFTSHIKCFPMNGKTIVYHFKGIDC